VERRKARYEISGPLAEQLAQAILVGEVPRLRVDYKVNFEGLLGSDSDEQTTMMVLIVTINDKNAIASAIRSFSIEGGVVLPNVTSGLPGKEKSDRPTTSCISLGTIDLVEECIKDALIELFPQFAETFTKAQTTSYSVMGFGLGEDSHLVSASIKFDCPLRPEDNEERRQSKRLDLQGVKCDGVDTVRASINGIVTFYHWLLWRMLRRERGQAKTGS